MDLGKRRQASPLTLIVATASVTAKALYPLFHDYRHHDECGNRIGPPPANERIQ
jgi:hypothetical protein